MSVAMKPGVQALTRSDGCVRARNMVYELAHAFESPYGSPSASPFAAKAALSPPSARHSSMKASSAVHSMLRSTKNLCHSGLHRLTKLGPDADVMLTIRPPAWSSSG